MILVSHDRALLEAVGSRTLVCEDGGCGATRAAGPSTSATATSAEAAAAAAAGGQARGQGAASASSPGAVAKNAVRKAGRLEEQIEEAEAELRAIEDELADPAAWSSPGRSERADERHEEAKRKVGELYEEWEEAEARGQCSGRSSLTHQTGARRLGGGAARVFVQRRSQY